LLAVGPPDERVLVEDLALLAAGQALEGPRAAQGVPDGPVPGLVQRGLAGALQEPELEIVLEAGAVAAPEHGELGAQAQLRGAARGEEGAQLGGEVARVLAEAQQAEAPRVADVFVDDAGEAGPLEAARQVAGDGRRVLARARLEDEQLHEEPAVHDLGDAVAWAPALADVHAGQGRLLGGALVVGGIAHHASLYARGAPRADAGAGVEVPGGVRPLGQGAG